MEALIIAVLLLALIALPAVYAILAAVWLLNAAAAVLRFGPRKGAAVIRSWNTQVA